MSSSNSLHPLQLAAELCLGLCVAFGVLALGGAPEWALWPIVALAWLSLALWLAGAAGGRRQARWHLILWLPTAVLALCLFQLVPLPPAVQRLLSPAAAELRDFALVPLGLERWRPISVEPSATWREVAKLAAYASVLFVTLQLGRSERSRRRLVGMLAALGGLVALIGLVHRLLAMDLLFGVYRFSGSLNLVSTIGNGNHLAAFLTVTGLAAVGMAVSAEQRQRSVAWAMGAVTIGLGVVLTLSRGGIGFFVLAQVLLGLMVVARRGGGWRAAAPIALGSVAVLLGGYLVADQLLERAATIDSVTKVQQSKVDLWPMFSEGAAAYSRMGMGRGAFEVAFTRFQTRQLTETFTHPENFVLQLASELGTIATAGLFAFSALCLVRLLRHKKLGLLEVAALCGLFGVALHDLFDFSLEMPATALAATVLAGAAFSAASDRAPIIGLRRTAVGAGVVLACLLAAAGLGGPSVARDEQSIASTPAGADPAALRAQVLPIIDRHPGDYLPYAKMANASALRGDAWESLAWVNRVLFLRPLDGPAHSAAGIALLRMGKRTQSLREFHLAFEAEEWSALALAVQSAQSLDDLERLVGDRADLLILVSQRLRATQRTADADGLLTAHLLPGSPLGLTLHAAEVAAVAGDHAVALALLKEAALKAPEDPAIIARMAAELAALGKADEAINALQTASARWPENKDLGMTLVGLHISTGKPARAREVLARMMPFASDGRARAALLTQEALSHEAEGHGALALKSWRTVAQLEPEVAANHYRLAEIEERQGRLDEAFRLVRKGIATAGADASPRHKEWLERLEKQIIDRRRRPPPDPLSLPSDGGDEL
jgi:tetratricopeptide (TPR) repeat protein